jgi:hypothetical protein
MAGQLAPDNRFAYRIFRLAAEVANHSCAASVVTPEPPRRTVEAPDPGDGPHRGVARIYPPGHPAAGQVVPLGAGLPAAPLEPISPARLLRNGRPFRRSGTRRQAARRTRIPTQLSVFLVLIGIFVSGLGLHQVTGANVLPSWLDAGSRPPPRKFPVLKASTPVGIKIPSIRLEAVVHNVGMAPDGTIAVPGPDRADEAGWYDQSPTPGQFGPAVLVGHVDTRNAPAVFHDLNKLRPGSKVEISREDRSVAIFEVNKVERFDKSQLPVQRVYGDFSRPVLRLITCGGAWVGGQTGYADNVIVFASLVKARRS